ncbi:ribonuclease III [Marinibactrum halimedae]|uniref:Ribonuclease 3 n=1 Tax=Marinibactrum halimedae TaxID=1444977 RepID=A0AA37T5F2_9GAMM|nr:ribonuclease III [Marinibactrum halimedae]MCD9459184.1 ribonuclease III [Marinibactrum halimedae]GLS27255.1 ribonuclease 3 [Marinibactrum halimedae]
MSSNPILIDALQRRIGYTFKDLSLLDQALTHRSFGVKNNERLEFLGDSILGFIIGEALYQQFSNASEGALTRIRSTLVKGETLAEIAREFQLGDCLILGEGEMKSGGFRRSSILADTVEAIIGAIYTDSDFSNCRKIVLNWYGDRMQSVSPDKPHKDPKTQLQELLQAKHQPLPDYEVVATSGEVHDQLITVQCRVSLLEEAFEATGKNRKQAEKAAAKQVLSALYAAGFKNK